MRDKPISDLRARMIADMTIRTFSDKTQRDYIRNVEAFARFLGRSPDTATGDDIRRFQLAQVEQGAQPPKLNTQASALRFFFIITLGRADLAHQLARTHYPRKLPRVLTPDQVAWLIEAAPGPGLKYTKAFAAFLAPLRNKRWFVYTKRPFAGPKAVLAYLSRYTHRVAISNRRLIACDGRRVTFKVKDYRVEGPGRYTTMTLDAGEFIRRFLIHVLPKGFHRIRHYGLFAGTNRAEKIAQVCKLLNSAPPAADASAKAQQTSRTDQVQPLVNPCPCCGGRMFIIETFEAGRRPRHQPTAPRAIRIDTS
jgi:Putative transposase/Phage integrase, N-terminal SAM-like domain